MIVTLELSAEEEATLEGVAEAAGVDTKTVLHRLIAQLSGPMEAEAVPNGGTDPNAAMERRREQEEVEANIQRWHAETKPD